MKNIFIVLAACFINFAAVAQKKAPVTTTKAPTTKKAAATTTKADPTPPKIDAATVAFDKELQGTWIMNEMTSGGTYVNAARKEVKYDNEKDFTPQERTATDAYKSTYLTQIASGRVVFDGTNVTYYILNKQYKGTYTLVKSKDVYNVTVNLSDGSKDTMQVAIKGGMLSMERNIKPELKAQFVFLKYVPKK